jgi:hypothetical protein
LYSLLLVAVFNVISVILIDIVVFIIIIIIIIIIITFDELVPLIIIDTVKIVLAILWSSISLKTWGHDLGPLDLWDWDSCQSDL